MSRILIHEPRQIHEQWPTVLSGDGREIVVRADRESLVAALAERRPDVLVYVVTDRAKDFSLLFALRGIAPALPIILLDGPMELSARRSIQELKPTYYGVLPLDNAELREVVRGTLGRAALR